MSSEKYLKAASLLPVGPHELQRRFRDTEIDAVISFAEAMRTIGSDAEKLAATVVQHGPIVAKLLELARIPLPSPTEAPVFKAPPYGVIASMLREGKLVLFLGAGASLIGNPRPPSTPELARHLAEKVNFPSQDPLDRADLARVASYYEDTVEREGMRTELNALLCTHETLPNGTKQRRFAPNELHRLVAALRGQQIIVTTNYDTLVEEALEDAKKPYHLIVYPADREDLAGVMWRAPGETELRDVATNEFDWDTSFNNQTVVFKIHGSVDPTNPSGGNFVITEDDYVQFFSRMIDHSAVPHEFYKQFARLNFLFLGYGLRDWNLRVLIKKLKNPVVDRGQAKAAKELRHAGAEKQAIVSIVPDKRPMGSPKRPYWAIQLHPSGLDHDLWDTRGVQIFDVGLADFVAKLHVELERLEKGSP